MEQLIYPLQIDQQATQLTTADTRALLEEVDLSHLLERYSVDIPVQWNEVLSLGEQQRLGMARLMFHRPRYAVLDECTSGVTTDMELRFTAILKRLGSTCITISHRPALVAFHDLVLALDGEGGWQLLPGQRNRRASQTLPEELGAGGVAQITGLSPLRGEGERASDARLVNAAMTSSTGLTASEEEGGALRTVLASVLPKRGMAVAEAAAAEMNAALMEKRLMPVRAALAGASHQQQWRRVATVLFARSTVSSLVRQFAGIGAIVVLRTLLQVRRVFPCLL
jgi:hypothetical protein